MNDNAASSRPVTHNGRELRILVLDAEPIEGRGLIDWILSLGPERAAAADLSRVEEARSVGKTGPDAFVFHPDTLEGLRMSSFRKLRQHHPRSRFLARVRQCDGKAIRRALEAGAHGVVCSVEPIQVQTTALLAVIDGRNHLSPLAGELIAGIYAAGPLSHIGSDVDQLAPREAEIFLNLGRGRTTEAIASELGISVKTVESHYDRIRAKLNVPTLARLRQRAALSLAQPLAPRTSIAKRKIP